MIYLDDEIELRPDLIVLTMATEGSEGVEELAKKLKIPVGAGKFFQEAHMKLRPLDFATDGIYLCGCAQSPKGVTDTIAQAIGAANKASIPMSQGLVKSKGNVAIVDEEKCIGCGICASVCAYDAIRVEENVAKVIEAKCKGCGCCGASCIERAIKMSGFTDDQLILQARAVLHAEVEK